MKTKITLGNFEEITKHHVKIINEAIGKRPITSEELEISVNWDLYKAGLMTVQDMKKAIEKYCQG